MKTIEVYQGQNIIDIAIRHYGDVSAIFQLLDDNALNLDSNLAANQTLLIDSSAQVNRDMVRLFERDSKEINTGDSVKPEGIGYWIIEQDNQVQ